MSIQIDEQMFERISSALNTLVGMSSVHLKDSLQEYISLANELDDMWNAEEED